MSTEQMEPPRIPLHLTQPWQRVMAALDTVEAAVVASDWALAGQCNRSLQRTLEAFDAVLATLRDTLTSEQIQALLSAFEDMVARHERCTEALNVARSRLASEIAAAREGHVGAKKYLEAAGP